EPARLAEERSAEPAVLAAADESGTRSPGRVDDLDLTIVRVGHVEQIVVISHAQDVLQPDLVADAIDVAELKKPFPNDGLDLAAAARGHGADAARLAVGDVERGAGASEPARLGKACLP